jgi:predicted metal-dependent peptidase
MTKNKKEKKKTQKEINLENLQTGMGMVSSHSIFSYWGVRHVITHLGKNVMCIVNRNGEMQLNDNYELHPKQWAFVIAHGLLHFAFGHFDADKMPGYEIEENGERKKIVECDRELWNMACDIYVNKFLEDIKFGQSPFPNAANVCPAGCPDEITIYYYLLDHHTDASTNQFGTASIGAMDMKGLDAPIYYQKWECNQYTAFFSKALVQSVQEAVQKASGSKERYLENSFSPAGKAAKWFVNHYPLLGGVAAHFKLVEDSYYCAVNDIHIAAIDVSVGELYVNPTNHYSVEEWKFILAHEYLHAGLDHNGRCNGRNRYLWNVACDYVINGWLHEMQIGVMPEDDLLYDEGLQGLSAESIYDMLLENVKKYERLNTLRGFHKCDFTGNCEVKKSSPRNGLTLDEFCKSALRQGLEYHHSNGRGFIPAGLIEEIRALSMPPIPWDVELAKWFDVYFEPLEKHRTYARPSRRQASTPDIPRPSYYMADIPVDSRTFGVVIDTSGSMSTNQIGKALGSIASYAAAHDVPFARVVFCDAAAYDAGYLSVDDIAGRVNVIGRGGTMLQPGVNLLESAKDFPKDGPILIITDGLIEDKLLVKHEHAFLMPMGSRLPFRAKGSVFYFE